MMFSGESFSSTPQYRAQRVLCYTLICSLLFSTVGCATKKPVNLTAIEHVVLPMPREEVSKQFGHRGQHQFMVLRDGVEYECVSYSFVKDFNRFYFLFRDGELQAIHVPTEGHFTTVIQEPGLSLEMFRADAEDYVMFRCGMYYLALPCYIVLSPVLLPVRGVTRATTNLKHYRWSKRFNPSKVSLGMSEAELIQAFGKPTFNIQENNKRTLAFGPKGLLTKSDTGDQVLKWNGDHFWVSVVLEQDKVIQIFSGDFFNESQIGQEPNFQP